MSFRASFALASFLFVLALSATTRAFNTHPLSCVLSILASCSPCFVSICPCLFQSITLDVEDLDEEASPEDLMLSYVSGEKSKVREMAATVNQKEGFDRRSKHMFEGWPRC